MVTCLLPYWPIWRFRSCAGNCKLQGINNSWLSQRENFSGQQRVTATFTQKDGLTLHVRKTTVAEPKLQSLYDALSLAATPGGARKLVN